MTRPLTEFSTRTHNGQHLGYCRLCVEHLTRLTTPRTWARLHRTPVQREYQRLQARP